MIAAQQNKVEQMTHKEAVARLEAVTSAAFSITVQTWRHPTDKHLDIIYRVSVFIGDECSQFERSTLRESVEEAVAFLNGTAPINDLDAVDESIASMQEIGAIRQAAVLTTAGPELRSERAENGDDIELSLDSNGTA
jgi:hypothetical protein